MRKNRYIFENIEKFKANGFDLIPQPGLVDEDIPFKGWIGYKASKLLQPWSKSQKEKIEYKTGIKFDESNAKGFPLEILFWMFKGHEWMLAEHLDTSVSQKGQVAAKGTLKTAVNTMWMIYLMVNYDFAEVMSMMKYQNQLYQVVESVKGYLSFIYEHTGLDLWDCFNLPEELNTNDSNISFERNWFKIKTTPVFKKDKKTGEQVPSMITNKITGEKVQKVKTTKELEVKRRWWLRSFDKPNKIANHPRPINAGSIVCVNIIEPVMFIDTGDVTSEMLDAIWANNKSSLFRYAREQGIYAQLITDMNNWDKNNSFIIIAELILPFDKKQLLKNKKMFSVSIESNWRIRRMTRYANELLKMNADEKSDEEDLKRKNMNLYEAQFLGAPYINRETVDFMYFDSILSTKVIDIEITPEVYLEELNKNLNPIQAPRLGLGFDFGKNDATAGKISLWVPMLGKLIRDEIPGTYISNRNRKKMKEVPIPTDMILSKCLESLIEFTTPFFQAGIWDNKENPCIVNWDGGSSAVGEIFENMIFELGLEKYFIINLSNRHGKDSISERVEFDNWGHSSGMIAYTARNSYTLEEYQNAKSKKSDPESREEKNQVLDNIDATNIAEEEIREYVHAWKAQKITQIIGKL